MNKRINESGRDKKANVLRATALSWREDLRDHWHGSQLPNAADSARSRARLGLLAAWGRYPTVRRSAGPAPKGMVQLPLQTLSSHFNLKYSGYGIAPERALENRLLNSLKQQSERLREK